MNIGGQLEDSRTQSRKLVIKKDIEYHDNGDNWIELDPVIAEATLIW
jgi:hypothetical protein